MYRMTSKLQAQNHTAAGGRRIQVRKSGVHGKGVFAARDIAKGEILIEYIGERITWPQALDRHPHDPLQPDHTFYFSLDGGDVIDERYTPALKKRFECRCGTRGCRGTMLSPKR